MIDLNQAGDLEAHFEVSDRPELRLSLEEYLALGRATGTDEELTAALSRKAMKAAAARRI